MIAPRESIHSIRAINVPASGRREDASFMVIISRACSYYDRPRVSPKTARNQGAKHSRGGATASICNAECALSSGSPCGPGSGEPPHFVAGSLRGTATRVAGASFGGSPDPGAGAIIV